MIVQDERDEVPDLSVAAAHLERPGPRPGGASAYHGYPGLGLWRGQAQATCRIEAHEIAMIVQSLGRPVEMDRLALVPVSDRMLCSSVIASGSDIGDGQDGINA